MYRIGVLTFHRANNYGAILQAYGTYMRLSQLGEDVHVELININYRIRERSDFLKYNFSHYIPKYKSLKNYMAMKRFLREQTALSKYKLVDNDEEAVKYINNQNYDLIVTGSDEVWKKNLFLPVPNMYWLPKGLTADKMSFAATANRTEHSSYTEDERAAIHDYLNDYCLISVRDIHTEELIRQITEKPIYRMCDPAFLYPYEQPDIERKVGKSGIDQSKIVIGFMGTNEAYVSAFKRAFGNKCEYVSFYQHVGGTKFIGSISPMEFNSIFSYMDLVVTSFFHGTIFSILNEVPFITIEMKDYGDMVSKIRNLLSGTEMEQRYFVNDPKVDLAAMIDLASDLLMEDDFDYKAYIQQEREKFDRVEKAIKTKMSEKG